MEHGDSRTFGSALILAGGKGSRIGYDKKKLRLNGGSVMAELVTKLGRIFDEVLVSSNNEFKYENVTALQDGIGAGPLAGIYQGLLNCKSEYLYVTACDMPFLSYSYIDFIKARIKEGCHYDACVASKSSDDGGVFFEPFNALWGKSCVDTIRAALENGVYKISPALKKLRLCVIQESEAKQFCGQADLFFNINCGADLLAAELLANTENKAGS
jgi:molybdopterin-guanine dinucleotide biosynthesis protein A